jgi:uncharacterized protein YbjT (DUF2867 family)
MAYTVLLQLSTYMNEANGRAILGSGRVAVRALTEGGHAGAGYVLTGPQALMQVEQVDAVGAAIGRPLRWEEMPRDSAREHRRAPSTTGPPTTPATSGDPCQDAESHWR